MTNPNPDAPLDETAQILAESDASNTEIAEAAQGYATVLDSSVLAADAEGFNDATPQSDPFDPPPPTLPTLPTLPTGFDWRVELKEHRDSTNLTDHGDYSDYDWNGWYWESGRPICGHRLVVVYLRQNGVILKQRSEQVEGLDTEWEFVSKVVETAEHLFNDYDMGRRTWLATDFTGLQEQ